ncbi:UDP-glycosyltransferase 91C1 [Platanthera guangdongensis]|uniref:UDP-glycosyltransferase 91C1 n=1 Tax=Platanthera guangdongensis TaxID=2320717 RepID=A0ABR2M9J8_9ASPA
MGEASGKLHLVMLPWLAMGHLLPFFQLSKRLALKGLHISFFSTAGNIRRLPPLPPPLTPHITFVPCSLSLIQGLPSHIENTVDLNSEAQRPLLDQAYASFRHHLAAFLDDPLRPKPDWIIYDVIATSWAPSVAARFNISCAFFSLFNAAMIAFFSNRPAFTSPEDLTIVPDHIPFPTTVAFRLFEARQMFAMLSNSRPDRPASSTNSDNPQTVRSSQLMLIRTCREFEPKWLDLVVEMFAGRMPVIPVGFLPPTVDDEVGSETWARIGEWLDRREARSVVYAAFGTEVKLTGAQIGEIAVGLEGSGQDFLWALRTGSVLPEGFAARNEGRGLVCEGWVPQARILGHPAVGGFLTHGGWNSVVEGLAVGASMVVLPMMFDQGLNARHLVESGYAVEVERNEEDGWFSGEEIGRKLRAVMVEEEGEGVRMKGRKGKEIFGSEEKQLEYDAELVKYLWEKQNTAGETVTDNVC